jgi:CRISPR/Cas system CSM-associated protein Csm3 (group 7 of RAMP superfamily)
MSRVRYEFAGRLVTVSPLHVGSGEFRHVATVTGREGSDKRPEVARIVRDGCGRPYLPGTAIKGLLRRLAEEIDDADFATCREQLFGIIKTARDDGEPTGRNLGRMGTLLCRGAEQVGPPPDTRDAPFADAEPVTADDQKIGPGIFVAARTRIDPKTGTAKDSGLFFQEMVAPQTQFAFRCTLDLRGDAAAGGERLASGLIRVLDRLTGDAGEAIGKGQADGLGRIRLDRDLTVYRHVLDGEGRFTREDATALWTGRERGALDTEAEVLDLVCDGPFIVIDASHRPEPGETRDGAPHLAAQRLAATMPLVLGSSVSGALRSRARWLAALDAHRSGDRTPVDGDRIVLRRSEIDSLTPVQRLFGVTGFRGLVEIDTIVAGEAEPWRITSVKLDRFSGAPVDNALFTTEAFVGVRLTLRLRLTSRGETAPRDEDRSLYGKLVADIRKNGLQLGHGGNKGFGWFSLAETANG